MRFVQLSGVNNIVDGGQSGTPVLSMPNLINQNVVKITVTFLARAGADVSNGFYYKIQPVKASSAKTLSSPDSIVQGNAGWQTTTKTVFFLVTLDISSPTADIDFKIEFSKGDLDGQGQFDNFLMTGEVVSLLE